VATIEVFADVACPFTHFGLRRLVTARDGRRAAVVVRVRAWPLERVNGHPLDPTMVEREVAALRRTVAPDLFRGFTAAVCPPTSFPAFGLAAAAYERGDDVGERVSLALRDALFEDGRDITDREVLRGIGARFGVALPEAEAAEAAVRVDRELGVARGVTGSPHFFFGARSWFCPSLDIGHADGEFDVHLADTRLREFYDAAFA
jgi:predicted DsbA family dithiol-disulfide isomerase